MEQTNLNIERFILKQVEYNKEKEEIVANFVIYNLGSEEPPIQLTLSQLDELRQTTEVKKAREAIIQFPYNLRRHCS
jgi:hypothetical protein